MGRRRVRGEGSIYQRESDGRWVAVVDLGRVNGKRVRRTVTAATKKELTPKFNKLKEQMAAGVLPDDATVEQWLVHWLDTIASERNRASTLRTYKMYVHNWLIPSVGHLRLDRLRPEHLRSLYAHMRAEGKADNTIRHVHTVVRRALEVAVHERKIPWNPAAQMDAPKAGTTKHGKLTIAEAKTVLSILGKADAEGEPLFTLDQRARWTLALLAGVRQGEALGLHWDNVDLEKGIIYVKQAAQRIVGKGIQVVDLKSAASERWVPLMKPAWFALEQLPSRDGFVFGGEQLRDSKQDWSDWSALLKTAAVAHRPVHSARATTASLLKDAGVPTKTISEILGQAHVQVTENHYLIGDMRSWREAIDAGETLLLSA